MYAAFYQGKIFDFLLIFIYHFPCNSYLYVNQGPAIGVETMILKGKLPH